MHLDLGRVHEPYHRIVGKVRLLHATTVERDAAVQRGRQGVNDAALHLRNDGIGIDRETAVDGADHAPHPQFAIRDFDVGNLCHDRAETLGERDPASLTGRHARTPARRLRGLVQHREVARALGEQFAAQFDRIAVQRMRTFVDEALGEERIVTMADAAPETHRHGLVGKHVRHATMGDVVGLVEQGPRWWCDPSSAWRRRPARAVASG